MNQQQFQQESSPRAHRMTEDETKAVIDLWQKERTESGGLTTSPAVEDLAEGLDISVDDVQCLLRTVRVRRAAEEEESREQFRRDLASLLPADKRDVPVDGGQKRLVRSLGSDYSISQPPAEEMSETARKENCIKAEDRRVVEYVLVALVLVLTVAHTLWYTFP